ncbi:hypothetical protein A6V39_04030 [Candidatus Mycoplasma haematobovis]|uniref:Lipoprotein n=1 Tax=Candidatus Mycoplasma haematobovis TaxID=432608 RepID=A0A1A9QC64_9MOLU|nr:hypothetical protein [Candidatus Mycoplasma haematobovis]OAL10057.1 hypothetical protein A6V39_04030 [Candidatus Mycoplasma haematobovis]
MSFPIKACALGAVGCIASAAIGLSQARSSSSVSEKLALEGYVLISSKEKIATEVWKKRATLYKDTKKNGELLLKDLDYTKVSSEGNEIKQKCESFTNGKVFFNSVKDIYEKIIKLCTLKINEYHESHFSDGDKFLTTDPQNSSDWTEIFEKNQEQIKKEIKDATKENAKNKLSEYCSQKYELYHSNENKNTSYNVLAWCIKKNKLAPVSGPKQEGSEQSPSN